MTSPKKPYQLVPPPKEFFRQFANLAHNRVLNEDFPHEKLLTLKYKGNASDFIVNAKGSISVKSESKATKVKNAEGITVEEFQKKDSYPTSSEVKFLTSWHNTSTEARINNKGIVKLWTHWGTHNVGEPVEVISVIKGDNQFNKSKATVSAYFSKGSVGSGTRVQIRREKDWSFNLAQKVTYGYKDLWAGAFVDVNLNDLKLTQYNALVGYNVNKKIHFYAEHITSKAHAKPAAAQTKTHELTTTITEKTIITEKANGIVEEKQTVTAESKEHEHHALLKKIGFGKGTLNGVYKDDKFWALAQVGWDEPTEKFTLDAGVVYTIQKDSSVRAKVNQDLNLAIGARHKCSKNFSINIGTSVPLKTPEKFYNAFNTVPIPFGSSLEFNF